MKNILILLLIGFTVSGIRSQTWPQGAKWIYWQDDFWPDGEDEYRVITVIGDTILHGRPCQFLLEKYIRITSGGVQHESTSGRFFLHQSGKRVYWVSPQDSTDIRLLYDFDAQAGDTLEIDCAQSLSNLLKIRIDSVTTTQVGTQPLRVQWVHTTDGMGCTMEGSILENVGWTFYLFARPGFVDPPPGGGLICYSDSLMQYPANSVCKIIVGTEEATSPSSKIYPNPTSGTVTLEGDAWQQVRVFDLFGRQQKNVQRGTEISLHEYPNGVYWLAVSTEQGSFFHKIILKR
ncbi:MAG: T9SS type A sorting domain-containing protein [Saprospiraceae bacterium]|nr:T9SS type A sorting domain-containing protein [Saprospiraceae bacterium]